MILENFKLSTLTSVALLTFSLNVFSADICGPADDIFQDEIAEQESNNQQYTASRDEGNLPETNEAYTDAANDNVATLSANSEAAVAEVTGETLDASEAVLSVSLESSYAVIGEVLGPIGLVVMVGLIAYGIVEVFDDPNSTDLDKANAIIGWAFPLWSIGYSIYEAVESKKEFYRKLYAINHVDHYKASMANWEREDMILGKMRVALESMSDRDIAAVKKITASLNEKISKKLEKKYLHHVDALQVHIKQLFAHQWIKSSPKFMELIDFVNQSNKAGKVIDPVFQSVTPSNNHWALLTDKGRVDSSSILGLGKFASFDASDNEVILKTNMSAIKSIQLDNTWFLGGASETAEGLVEAHYLVVTLRDKPGQDEGVEYYTYSISISDNLAERVKALTTTENFVNAGWVLTDSDYIATDLRVSHAISAAIPSVITGKTTQLCGINQHTGNFLMTKSTKQINICLEHIFQDYKDYFAAYNLDDTIQVTLTGEENANVPFEHFLRAYGESYNHLVAQTKIKIINNFYEIKNTVNKQSCGFYSDRVESFLAHANTQLHKEGKKDFERDHNTNTKGQSLDEDCWETVYWKCRILPGSGGQSGSCYAAPLVPPKYECDLIPYVPQKDELFDLEKSIIRQQVKDEERNCLTQKDPAATVFAKKLTAQGNFYLDRADTRLLFEDIFEGVRIILMKRFVKNAKIHRMLKTQNGG
ncbi:MAG: hypothetical protein FE834_01595 [Gammaproteobacteria bacterium]|nr:hypothetical protein [Gammaproteobacteria bacterium]